MKTIVGLYDNMHDAEEAITDLVQAGFDRSDISLMAADRWADDVGAATSTGATGATGATVVGATQGGAVMAGPGTISGANGTTMTPDDDIVAPTGDQLVSDVTTGAVTGGVVGGLTGVLLGLGVLAIPGFGPVLAAGPLVAGLAGAGLGAAVGGLVGALVSWGVPQEEAELYAESVRRGSILVGVKTPDERAQQAVNVMNNHGPVDVERRSEYWRSSGWAGYDPNAPAWSDAEVDSDRLTYSNYLDYSAYAPAFREHYQTAYGNTGRDYTYYDPAYRYGYALANDERYRAIDTWDELEADARTSWEKGENAVQGAWDDFKDAVRRGWEEVKDAFDVEADYADFETGYRQHYQSTYGNSGREYDWYGPAYRYGYNLAMDERWDDYETWDELEAEARREWEGNNTSGLGGAWDDFKDAVRRGWEDVKDAFDAEDDYYSFSPSFREHYDLNYGNSNRDFDYYDPAYRYGYNLAIDDRYADYDGWDQLEAEARSGWSDFAGTVDGTWEDFKDAVRHAWEDVKDALDIEADYAGREERYRSHYETLYRNTLRDYSWYEPAYRHGYIMGMDERYDDFDTWEEAEAQAREDWEQNHPASENGNTATAWEEIKEAVRQGWDSVREAFDIDDDVAVPPGTGGPDGYFRPSNG